MFIHRCILNIWLLELIVFPVLALLDLGFSFGINSNFYARFPYVIVFLLSLTYLLALKGRIINHPLNYVFFGVLIIGMFKGAWENTLSNMASSGVPIFFSHIFYVVMPIVMISYGWFFFDDYKRSLKLQTLLSKMMYFAFYFGVGIVIVFAIAFHSGFAAYDAIGLWNFVYSAPYLLYQSHGLGYFGVAFLATIIAAKRGILVVIFAYIFIFYVFARGFRILWIFVVVTLITAFFASYMFSDLLSSDSARLLRTVYSLQEGNLNEASAGRWVEAISALEHLNSSAEHLLFGAGFGAKFLPWPDLPGYTDYWSHYTHFGIISYFWIGGLLLPIVVYAYLISTGVNLILKIKLGQIDRSNYHFVYWLWGIIIISLLGAVLMNNSFLWFVIGCCFNLNNRSSEKSLQTKVTLNL